MKKQLDVYASVTALVFLLSAYFALYASPPEATMGNLVRIFYFHLPPAIICYLSLLVSVAASLLYLRTRQPRFDALSESGAQLGVLYGFVTLVSGSIWANATWGVYWNWDPRETTTLVLWFAYIGYFLLRMSVENPDRRNRIAAVYNILAFATVPLSYLSFILWPSLHPRLGEESGGLGLTGTMVQALVLNIVAGLMIFGYLLRETYKTKLASDPPTGGQR